MRWRTATLGLLVLCTMTAAITFTGCRAGRDNHGVAYAPRDSDGDGMIDTLEGAIGIDPFDLSSRATSATSIAMDQEIWVIAKAAQHSMPVKAVVPGLSTEINDKNVPLPLKHTDVNAHISGFLATVDVTQRYENPFATKIEATYVFPLPEDAAVTDFVMTIGTRKIRGMLRERKEAEALYARAKAQGYRAALLTQERPNIFTQKVANIEPGKRIDVSLSYFHPLPIRDNEYEFVFPSVVGPRFDPTGTPAGPRVNHLKPNERSGHDISVTVDIHAGLSIEDVHSRSHVVHIERPSDSRALVSLSPNDRIPNKDLAIHYRTAGKKIKTAMMVDRGKKGNHFAMILQPPERLSGVPRMPREMVFVLDCSGSMSGKPLNTATRAAARCLHGLDKNDTFQIIRFSDNASSFGKTPLPATPENVKRGLTYLDNVTANGGTHMLEGIHAALEFPHTEGRLRIVSFMTDGYISNEDQILAAIRQKLGASRIFSFGIGSSVNRHLLARMASFGRGAVAYIGLNDNAALQADLFYERIAHPPLTDVTIDWENVQVSDVYPKQIPDLFVGRPVLLCGKFKGNGQHTFLVRGRVGTAQEKLLVKVDLDAAENQHPAITHVWARWKLRELAMAEIVSPSETLRNTLLSTSLTYGVLCRYTAFLAIDSLERTTGNHGVAVPVRVPVPDGVRYETTVEE